MLKIHVQELHFHTARLDWGLVENMRCGLSEAEKNDYNARTAIIVHTYSGVGRKK